MHAIFRGMENNKSYVYIYKVNCIYNNKINNTKATISKIQAVKSTINGCIEKQNGKCKEWMKKSEFNMNRILFCACVSITSMQSKGS